MHKPLNICISLVSMALLCGCAGGASGSKEDVWTRSSFADFAKGHFGDGGANSYVSARGRIQTIHRWDLNDDGEIDLVFANTHAQAEKLDSVIYWGDGKDFSDKRVTPVPNEGAQHCVAADLDGDGVLDLVVPNYANGTWSKMPSAVYYGAGAKAKSGEKAPGDPWDILPFARKRSLPTEAAQAAAVADLNRDGYPDLIFAQSAGFWEYRGGNALASPIRIYWGSADGYSPDRHQDIEASGASDVAVADLNHDGWPDLVIANRENAGKFDVDSYVYFGSERGFSAARREALPTKQVNAVTLADVNGDGFADIIFANGKGDASYVYLNQNGHFDPTNRIELPTSDSRGCATADLNGDGSVDIFFTNYQTLGNPLTTSYLYWGSPSGFSPQRRQTFETVGAWGVSLADLNGDGRPDIVVSNFQEYTSFDVPSYIFWNSVHGFSNDLRTSLFTHGAVGNIVADFNGDGHPDILFCNTMNRRRGGVTPSFVYWGNKKGNFSPDRRLELPAVEPYNWAAADLDDDGKIDLMFANMAETGRRNQDAYIYWGQDGNKRFSPDRRSGLMGVGGRALGVADLDRDGYLDVILFNSPPGLGTSQSGAPPSTMPAGGVFIYWGGPDGFVTSKRTELPGPGSGLPTVADLDNDGNLDVVVPGGLGETVIYRGDGTRNYSTDRAIKIPGSQGMSNAEVADLNRDGYLDLILTYRGTKASYIYYGNASGEFSADRRTSFTPLETQGVTIGDLNQDGWLDIVAPAYKDGGTRATLSTVFWGGPDGISDAHTLKLPTNGGTGSQIADYNHDGYNDLLLICHRAEGNPNKVGAFSDHVNDSYLYWGGPDGLKPDRKSLIPGEGPHYDSGVDIGNIYNRNFQFDYISSPHNYGTGKGKAISWHALLSAGTKVRFQIRTASSQTELSAAPWEGPKGKDSYFEQNGMRMNTPLGHSWIQYRAVLESANGANSPVLDSVSLRFR